MPTNIRRDASIHPRTVTDLSKNRVKTRKASPRTRSKNGKVNHIKVDLRVWKKAVQLAGKEMTRIEVISATDVIVHNPGWKKNGRTH